MDVINDIVSAICRSCRLGGVEVPDLLAAFIARTVVESDPGEFRLDQSVKNNKVSEVIMRSVERLLERNSPSLETLKMQIDYEISFTRGDADVQKDISVRNRLISSHKSGILDVVMSDANDFEALTTLYRKIFRFLLEFTPGGKSADRSAEREVAAALESVFPRVGLKAFISLSNEDKGAQLMELGRIVLGIRLFNRDQGRGGAGIDDMDSKALSVCSSLVTAIDEERGEFLQKTEKYQRVISNALLLQRRRDIKAARDREGGESAGNLSTTTDEASVMVPIIGENEIIVSKILIDRWTEELSNRRQYLVFCETLNEEVIQIDIKIKQLVENIGLELVQLTQLVGSKASVPKEMVYPRFDALGATWIDLYDEYLKLNARAATFDALLRYRASFSPEYTEEFLVDDLDVGPEPNRATLFKQGTVYNTAEAKSAYGSQRSHTGEEGKELDANEDANEDDTERAGEKTEIVMPDEEQANGDVAVTADAKNNSDKNAIVAAEKSSREDTLIADEKKSGGDISIVENRSTGNKPSQIHPKQQSANVISTIEQLVTLEDAEGETGQDLKAFEGAVNTAEALVGETELLTIENCPAFTKLPLELQGFCPWTISHARGLLAAGQPSLGVVKYDRKHFVFENPRAMRSFMRRPAWYISRVKERALANPEYIQLLRIDNWFPSVGRLVRIDRPSADTVGVGSMLKGDFGDDCKPKTHDASTGTPTHFVERHIDVNYHWNEWELRRRALSKIKLRSCATTSAQTDASHFRRDNTSQVYEPRTKETQTRRDKGTNPPIVTTYMAGLRGKRNESKLDDDVSEKGYGGNGRARIVTLKLDL